MKINYLYGYNCDSYIYIIAGEILTIIDCGTGLHNDEVEQGIKKNDKP